MTVLGWISVAECSVALVLSGLSIRWSLKARRISRRTRAWLDERGAR